MDLIDFPDMNEVNYGGSERKESILVPNGDGTFSDYMLKFRRRRSEHGAIMFRNMSDPIFEPPGFNVQKTFLGTFEGEEVVACKSFVEAGEQFVPFNDVGESTTIRQRTLSVRIRRHHADAATTLGSRTFETIAMFWEMFIVDAHRNFDRHGLNWGFVAERRLPLAPVFDNGSCLFPLAACRRRRDVASSARKRKREPAVLRSHVQTAAGGKSSYYEVVSSLSSTSATEPCAIVKRADMDAIHSRLVASVLHKRSEEGTYDHMLDARFDASSRLRTRRCEECVKSQRPGMIKLTASAALSRRESMSIRCERTNLPLYVRADQVAVIDRSRRLFPGSARVRSCARSFTCATISRRPS